MARLTQEQIDALEPEWTLVLRKPVHFAGQDYTELNLKEPTAGQVEKFSQKRGVESDILAVSLVAGVPEGAIRQIGARDLTRAGDYILGFLGEGPSTGPTA